MREHLVAESWLWRFVRQWLPRWYRERYADDLLALHVDRALAAAVKSVWRFWLSLMWDVLVTGVQVRLDTWAGGEARRIGVMDAFRQEMVLSLRRLSRQPAFAATVVVTLGLGIGANVMMFSILDRLLLSPPAGVAEADGVRRVFVLGRSPFSGTGSYAAGLAYPDYEALAAVGGFAGVAGHTQRDMTVGSGESTERITAEYGTASYFELLGLRPALGRFYDEAEDAIGAVEPTAVLSHAYWQRRFGGDPGVLGESLELGKGRYTVIGVMPRSFTGTGLKPTEVWVPLRTAGAIESGDQWREAFSWYWFAALVRLPDGVTADAAAVEATARYRSTRAGQRNADPEARIVLASLIPGRSPEPTREARVTMALGLVALFVLVIACANVTNLLLARGIQRRRQYAVQSALGMRRSRVIIQLLTETLVLAVLGGGVAILMAGLAGPVLIRTLLPDGAVTATGGTRAVLATTLLVTVTTLLVAVLPSWRASRVQLLDALRSRSASRGIALLRRSLLGVQAALSMVLLVGAGLFVRSLHGAATLDVGLSQDVLLIDLELEGGTRSGDPVAQTVYSLLERLRADPAIESAAGTSLAPWSGMWGLEMDLPGPDSFASGVNGPMFYAATGDYFQTMGLAIVRGRPLTDGDDRENAAPVAVVNETMANSAWPGRDPVGQCLLIGAGEVPCTEVVGVVRDHLPSLTAASARPTYYLAPHHAGIGFVAAQSIVVRPRGVPAPLVPILRATIREAAPHVRYADVGLLADTIDRQMVSWRLGATLLTIFGILALLVAGAGFYGVIAFDVAQRRFELSVRSVLGAPRVRLLRTVIGRAVVVTLTGMAIGLAGAAALGRFIAPMLFRVSPTDPIVYAIVCITLVSAAVIAGLGPALRAIRSDPAVALRE